MQNKTIQEIRQALQCATSVEDWMKNLQNDPRIGVQKEWARWQRQFERKQQLLERFYQKYEFDRQFKSNSTDWIAGVDEAGRGPLAGPVVSAAVILPVNCESLVGVDDSKAISRERREQLAEQIKAVAIDYTIHIQSVTAIDTLNIYEATKQSMTIAVSSLRKKPHFTLVDAMNLQLNGPTKSIIKGDAKSLAIAAASILAKTTRDQIMQELHDSYPMYQFHRNAGYGTKEHVAALQMYGPCPQHRQTFEPVKTMMMQRGEGVNELSIATTDFS